MATPVAIRPDRESLQHLAKLIVGEGRGGIGRTGVLPLFEEGHPVGAEHGELRMPSDVALDRVSQAHVDRAPARGHPRLHTEPEEQGQPVLDVPVALLEEDRDVGRDVMEAGERGDDVDLAVVGHDQKAVVRGSRAVREGDHGYRDSNTAAVVASAIPDAR